MNTYFWLEFLQPQTQAVSAVTRVASTPTLIAISTKVYITTVPYSIQIRHISKQYSITNTELVASININSLCVQLSSI